MSSSRHKPFSSSKRTVKRYAVEMWVCIISVYAIDGRSDIVRTTPLGAGFVDIFIGQMHSESDDQIQ